jgi:hypothetical protein
MKINHLATLLSTDFRLRPRRDFFFSLLCKDANNPAWRGVQQQQQHDGRSGSSNSSQSWTTPRHSRYLYDHKNPNKPIPAHQGSGGTARFPVDVRFAHPPPQAAAYRPPFPPMSQPPPPR